MRIAIHTSSGLTNQQSDLLSMSEAANIPNDQVVVARICMHHAVHKSVALGAERAKFVFADRALQEWTHAGGGLQAVLSTSTGL